MTNCSLGDDETVSYEDTCTVTCNAGYELTGDDTRTCQSDGTFNGTDATCDRGTENYHVYVVNQSILSFLSNTY